MHIFLKTSHSFSPSSSILIPLTTMTDKVNPTAKPPTKGGGATMNPSFPATKAQIYGATRPTYRPQRPHHRTSRSCCCTLCCYLILILIFFLILLGIAGTVLYFFYRPHLPSFTLTSLKLTSSSYDFTLSTTNPNNKITFSYQPISVSILASDVDIGDGVIPSFEHGTKNTTLLKASVVRSEKRKNIGSLALKFETKVEAKMGMFKTPNVGIRVLCYGVDFDGEKTTTASTTDAKCGVDVKFKVWKWTFG